MFITGAPRTSPAPFPLTTSSSAPSLPPPVLLILKLLLTGSSTSPFPPTTTGRATMFHSFDSRRSPEGSAVSLPTTSRKVNRSCQECTRRKVKCDGGHPCASCQYYKVADSCEYRQRSRRHAVSRRIVKADDYPSTLEKTSEQLRAQSSVLQKLFPDVDVNDLVGKSRAELLALLPRESLFVLRSSVPQADPSPAGVSAADEDDDDDGHDDSAQNSENGDAANERRWDEPAQQPAALGSSDDINAISLATDQHRRSYLGVTSMSAVLRVIFRLCPAAKEHTAQRAKAWNDVHYQSQLLPSLSLVSPGAGMNPLREQRCIDFYFDHIHPVTPILNEDDFRRNLASGTRLDGSWLALLNMVYTLGSIASGSDSVHVQYYKQARAYLDLDSLGSGNMESLQALCLLGGYYLHYRNSPNMAYAVLGAAHRVAIALGLHREPARSRAENVTEHSNYLSRAETRRRTWWSLFCLDTWASMTLGRPTCGRWDSSTMDTLLPTPLFPDDHVAASLRASCLFCHICDRIQHRFAQPARLSAREAMAFDRELVEWHDCLPDFLKNPANSPPRLTEAREFMRNRYLNVRLILTRSFLLYLAHDHSLRRGANAISTVPGPSPDELALVETCRSVAMEAIDAITLYWTPNRIHVWNSAWYLFQACMVPILSIAIDTHVGNSVRKQQQQEQSQYPPPPSTVPSQTSHLGILQMPTAATINSPEHNISLPSWCASLTKALELFNDMRSWMRDSDRTPDIVGALYEAVITDLEGSGAGSAIRTPSTENSIDLSMWCDEQLVEMDWSAFLGGGDGDGSGGVDGMHNNNMFVF
ncbi:fungal specific transcription factor domain-containing protein [Colletotrichum cuscutae]|uniref:Fungal specific transcription factor domain-containing protein n=1 Tax=Colletotrichum cuscutae TaxID=1209917 RepID=A0AAJ0DMP8_9PEZI|nr:fungal specific transcription factor domain-containing protein [Colletotrichum cuscutae]